MQQARATQTLHFPHPRPPAPGALAELAAGVQWLRLPLPYRFDHVNIRLIADGWAVLDTGLGTDDCRAGWEAVLAAPLAGEKLTRMIVTQYHPDHVGLAEVVAPTSERPIDGGMATEALVAHVVVSKFCDSLPLYRQAQMLARQGVTLDRSTLSNWVGRACWWLTPLYELVVNTVLRGR